MADATKRSNVELEYQRTFSQHEEGTNSTRNKYVYETEFSLLGCCVWSTLLYGCESWTVSQRMKSQLEATETWFLRRMLRIAWTDKVPHKEVLQRANTSRNPLKVTVNRQIRFVGHIMRKSQLEAIALTGMTEGKKVEVNKGKRL